MWIEQEIGDSPTLKTLVRLVEVLEVRLDELVVGTTRKSLTKVS